MASDHLKYQEIVSALEKSRVEKENQHHYLRNIVDHIGIGLISFSNDGNVELYNEAARRLFLIEHLHNIDQLDRIHADLPAIMRRMRSGQQRLFKALVYGEMAVMSMKCSVFKIRDHEVKLVSFQDIVHEMEGEEIESWQKLIKVLTHEIVNSVTPVNTITSSIIRMLEKEIQLENGGSDTLLQSLEGLKAVAKRNSGLIDFINTYRNLTRIPKPVFSEVKIQSVIEEVIQLMQVEMEQKSIDFKLLNDAGDIVFQIDEKLITQVIINLLKNAIHAVHDVKKKEITLKVFVDEFHGRFISISDNGCGIPDDELDKIFIPFFTTNFDGSGIGLSLSRQIMRLHKGSISVRSEEGKGSMFTLRF
jgi:two-component system nitrogen regulation sensor histidine kinase NtrY